MMRRTKRAAAFLFAAAALAAQEDGIDAAKAERLRLDAAEQAAREAVPQKVITPTPPAPPVVRQTSGLRALAVSFDPACRPRRVAPGGNGTLTIVMALKGTNVLPAPPQVRFEMASKQGPVELEAPAFRPPPTTRVHSRAPAIKERPVYDDCAIVDIPFHVEAGAKEQTQKVVIDLTYTLTDGMTRAENGPFTDRIECNVVVGPPVPDPVPLVGTSPSQPAVGSADEPVRAAVSSGPDAPANPSARSSTPVEAAPVADVSPSTPHTAEEPVAADGAGPDADSSSTLVVVVGAGVLALAALLLKLRRA